MPKALIVRLSIVLLVLGCAMQAFASSSTLPKRTGVVNDYAHVMDAAAVSRIRELSNELYEKTDARVTILTVPSLAGDDIRSYSNQVFRSWGIGAKGSDRGVLIVLAVQERKYRVEVGYGLEAILPDGKVGGFGRDAVPLFKGGQYSAALEQMFNAIAAVIADDRKVSLSSPARPSPPVSTQPAATEKVSPAVIAFTVMFFAIPLTIFSVFIFALYKFMKGKTMQDLVTTLNSRGGSIGSGSNSDFSSSSSSSDSGSSDSGGFSGGDSGGGGADGSF